MSSIITSVINSILGFIHHLGYLGILIGMTLESSFFPFPSEVLLIPAGALIAQGKMNAFLVFGASMIGSLVGASINFFLALYLGRTTVDMLIDKYGKFLFFDKSLLDKTDVFFEKHGEITTVIGRLIPVVRELISLPAGFAKMNFTKFIIFTFVGSAIWDVFLMGLGYFFGSTAQPTLKWIVGMVLAVGIIAIVIHFIRKKRKSH